MSIKIKRVLLTQKQKDQILESFGQEVGHDFIGKASVDEGGIRCDKLCYLLEVTLKENNEEFESKGAIEGPKLSALVQDLFMSAALVGLQTINECEEIPTELKQNLIKTAFSMSFFQEHLDIYWLTGLEPSLEKAIAACSQLSSNPIEHMLLRMIQSQLNADNIGRGMSRMNNPSKRHGNRPPGGRNPIGFRTDGRQGDN